MAKKNKKPVFGDSDSDDDDGGNGFDKYLKSKSEHSKRKTMEAAAETSDLIQSIENEPAVKKSRPQDDSNQSQYIDRLLQSKKEREMDKMYAKSMKLNIERELDGSNEVEQFVTDSYRGQKEIYERVEGIVSQELRNERNIEQKQSLSFAQGVATTLLMNSEQSTQNTPIDLHTPNIRHKSISRVSNDIFIAKKREHKLIINDAHDQVIQLDKHTMEKAIGEFLKCKVTEQNIDFLKQKYLEHKESQSV